MSWTEVKGLVEFLIADANALSVHAYGNYVGAPELCTDSRNWLLQAACCHLQ